MVKTGLETLIHERLDLLKDRQVGLVTHPAAVLPDFTPIAPALLRAGVRLAALFGPEHGLSGAVADGAAVTDARDPDTGLPVYSLYGQNLEPTPAMLAGLDVLVFDMQDVGVRFYTYVSTLYYVLRAAHQASIPLIVLDRPDPIRGDVIEGPSITAGYESFVGILPIPIRPGLTMGELALYMNNGCGGRQPVGADLQVVPLQGWRRSMWFDQTGLSWVPTSPAMPHLSTAVLYPGLCLLEGTNLSVGRGTALPFEICGAPWLPAVDLAGALNDLSLAGVRFRPTDFTPCASQYAGQACQGIQVHVTGRDALRPVALGLHLLALLRQVAPAHFQWQPAHFDRLAGGPQVRQALEQGLSVGEILSTWQAYLERFSLDRSAALLYPTLE